MRCRHTAQGRRGAARSRGLSLIEVIVALVVISGFGAALFVWAGQTLQMVSRAAALQQQTELERNITELASSLNPAERPSGEVRSATHRYQWRTNVSRGPTDQTRHPIGISPYEVALYSVRFTVTDLAAPATPLLSDRVVAGYRQVRSSQTGMPGFSSPRPPPR